MSTSLHGIDAGGLAEHLIKPDSDVTIDHLLDSLVALFTDIDQPTLRRNVHSIDQFCTKYSPIIARLQSGRLNIDHFDVVKVIGRGAFGEVQLVRHRQTRRVHALKMLNKYEVGRRGVNAVQFWSERDIMASAECRWIVQLHYAFQDARFLYMCMEFMPGGDLVGLMNSHPVTEACARFYAAELVECVSAVHALGYIHRDIKPDNMLLTARGHVKLADFGTCVRMSSDLTARCSSAIGTPDYISPEMLRSQGTESTFGREVDYWSIGIFLYEMLCGDTPFYASKLTVTYARIMDHKNALAFPDNANISDNCIHLIRSLLCDADDRLGRHGADTVRAHPFFVNDAWTFDTIAQAEAPVVPELQSDDDTSYFDDITASKPTTSKSLGDPAESLHTPSNGKTYTGAQLPFIGFTLTREQSVMSRLRLVVDAEGEPKSSPTPSVRDPQDPDHQCATSTTSETNSTSSITFSSSLEDTVVVTVRQQERMSDELYESRASLVRLEQQLCNVNIDERSLQTRCKELEDRLVRVKIDKETTCARLQSDNVVLQSTISSLQSALSTSTDHQLDDGMRDRLASMSTTITQLHNDASARDEQMSVLRQTEAERHSAYCNLGASNMMLNAEKDRLKSEIIGLTKSCQEARQREQFEKSAKIETIRKLAEVMDMHAPPRVDHKKSKRTRHQSSRDSILNTTGQYTVKDCDGH